MSLGSRITKRGKAAIVASLASTPREPLYFLYPQWTRNSSTAPEPAFVHHGRPHILSSRHYTNPSTVRCSATANPAVEPSYEIEPAEDEPGTPTGQNAEEQGDVSNSVEEGGPPVAIRNTETDLPTAKVVRTYYTPTNKDRYSSAKLRLKNTKATKDWESAQASVRSKSASRQRYLAVKREEKQSWIPDWRVILADLRKHTPQNDEWLRNAVYVSVPESAVETLLHGVDDNIWDIADRYGCSVELASRDTATEQFNEFCLRGSAQSISRTTADIKRIAPKSKIRLKPAAHLHEGPNTTTPQPAPRSDGVLERSAKVRNVSSESRAKTLVTRPENIPRPDRWTKNTLVDYIDKLTSLQVPNHMHRLLYKNGEDHTQSVVDLLGGIITDPQCKPSMSRTAFKKLLDYLIKTNNKAEAKAAFVHMEMMEIPMDPEVFNIMLRGAAKSEDLHNFHFILHVMLRRGISPNGKTWLAFLMASTNFHIKTHIVTAMKQKGLLGHMSVLRGACQQLIMQEIHASVDRAESLEIFLWRMNTRYGPDWLTVDSGNRVLHFLSAHRLISGCWEFLQAMEARGVKIDQVSINTVLNQCKRAMNVAGAVEFMKRLPSLTPIQPDQDTYHALFELAWRDKRYNLARVVWKYACLNAATSAQMRMRIRRSLRDAVKSSTGGETLKDIWKREIGVVAISVLYPPTPHSAAISSPADSSALDAGITPGGSSSVDTSTTVDDPPTARSASKYSPATSSTLGLEGTPGGTFSLKDVLGTMDLAEFPPHELQTFVGLVPTRPFGEMLEKAWERDQDWWASRKRSEWPGLDWKLRGAIQVPARKRSYNAVS